MPDNLRITTPMNTENVNGLKNNKQSTAIPNIDPTKVLTKSDDAKDAGRQTDLLDGNSVFGGFVASLSKTPLLSESLGKLVAGLLATLSNEIKSGNAVNPSLSALAGATVMTKEEMLDNILFQQNHITAFSGSLFKLLKRFSSNSSDEFSAFLGRFLKAYDSYASSNTTLTGVSKQLKDILAYIPKSYRAPIEQSVEELRLPTDSAKNQYGVSWYPDDADLDFNLTLLKEQVLPQLARYIAAFNDFGEIRDKISLLIHNISMLNVGSRSLTEDRFQELLDYCRYEMNFSSSDITEMKQLFSELMYNPPLNYSNKLIDALANTMIYSPNGGVSGMSQSLLADAIRALLLDYSVYMPFYHLFLPVLYQNAFMFADIWMEKSSSEQNQNKPKKNTIYIRFDIKDFGLFQGEIFLQGKEVTCNLYVEKFFAGSTPELERAIKDIFNKNGFPAEVHCFTETMNIYDKIKQRVHAERDGVNVTI